MLVNKVISGGGNDGGASNADYVKQQDLIASINYGRKYNESDYTEEKIKKIQELLDDMVIGG